MIRLSIDTPVGSEEFMAICETGVSEGEFWVLFDRLSKVFCGLADILYFSPVQVVSPPQV